MLSAFTANGVISNLVRLSTTALIVDEGRAVEAGHTGDANAVNVSRMTEVRCYATCCSLTPGMFVVRTPCCC